MKIKPFNEADYDCEVLGFYEEFVDAETFAFLGKRTLTEAGQRAMGSDGRQIIKLTEPLPLLKGYKQKPVTVPAGRTVISMVQVICGKNKNQTWKKDAITTTK